MAGGLLSDLYALASSCLWWAALSALDTLIRSVVVGESGIVDRVVTWGHVGRPGHERSNCSRLGRL